MVKLATPSLYRVASAVRNKRAAEWRYQGHLHPIPTQESDELGDVTSDRSHELT